MENLKQLAVRHNVSFDFCVFLAGVDTKGGQVEDALDLPLQEQAVKVALAFQVRSFKAVTCITLTNTFLSSEERDRVVFGPDRSRGPRS